MIWAITLDTSGDVVKLLLIACIVGAIASVVAELLVSRGKAAATGAFELPGRIGNRFYDIGSFAAIPVGILASGIAGLTLTPTKEVTAAGKTTETMQVESLIAVSAIAGLASASFLKVLADRFVAAMKTQGLDVALRNAISALKDLEQNPVGDAGAGGGSPTAETAANVRGRARQARESAEDALGRLTGTP